MKRVNMLDAKTSLSRSLRKKGARKPRIGVAKCQFVVPDSFFEPLPDEILKAFRAKMTVSSTSPIRQSVFPVSANRSPSR
jgi:hypothetical protein